MAAGTVTITEERLHPVKKIVFAWVAGTGAEEGTASGTTTYSYTGNILKAVTVPGLVGLAPSADYDITLTDQDSIDVANSQLLNRHTSNTEWVVASLGVVVGDRLTINVTAAGSAKAGTCTVYVGMADSGTVDVDVENALYGTTGVVTFPAAAVPANNVSIAEVLRSVWAALEGTAAGENGIVTWPAAAAPGNGVSLAEGLRYVVETQLAGVVQQTARTTAAKAVASLTSANLFTIAGGPVRVLALVGQITTGIEAAENNTKLTHTPTGGAAVDLCATADLTGAAIRKVIALDGVAATTLQVSTDIGVVIASALHMPIILTAGTLALSCSATTDGVISWYVEYEPLAPGATITAA